MDKKEADNEIPDTASGVAADKRSECEAATPDLAQPSTSSAEHPISTSPPAEYKMKTETKRQRISIETTHEDETVSDKLKSTPEPAEDSILTSELEEKIATSHSELLMIEDSTDQQLPPHLVKLLEQITSHSHLSRSQIMFVLMYGFALESGFQPFGARGPTHPRAGVFWGFTFNVHTVNYFAHRLPDYNYDYELGYAHMSLNLCQLSDRQCFLIIRRVGDSLCLTFNVEASPGKSVLLQMSRYILRRRLHSNPSNCFQNLKELAAKMRSIFEPIRNLILLERSLPYPGFLGIPEVVYQKVLSFLDQESLEAVRDAFPLRYDDSAIKGDSKSNRISNVGTDVGDTAKKRVEAKVETEHTDANEGDGNVGAVGNVQIKENV